MKLAMANTFDAWHQVYAQNLRGWVVDYIKMADIKIFLLISFLGIKPIHIVNGWGENCQLKLNGKRQQGVLMAGYILGAMNNLPVNMPITLDVFVDYRFIQPL